MNTKQCAVLFVRDKYPPKIDFIYRNIIKLPAGTYYLVPVKVEN